MAHEHHHEEKSPLSFFASPLHAHEAAPKHVHSHAPSTYSDDVEHQKNMHTTMSVPFANNEGDLHDTPAFHRHAEATTAELFYDLCE
jgi:hypothetical protein